MISRPISRPISRSISRAIAGSANADAGFLSLDFVSNTYNSSGVKKQFGELIEFSRPSGGGIWNSQGDFEWLGTDVPRFEYDPVTGQPVGLLVEPQRTNTIARPSLLSGWSEAVAGDATATQQGITAGPDALGLSVQVMQARDAVGNQRTYTTSVPSFPHAVYSIMAAPGGHSIVGLQYSSPVGSNSFDLINRKVSNASSGNSVAEIRALKDGWSRCAIKVTQSTINPVTPWISIPRELGAPPSWVTAPPRSTTVRYLVGSAQMEEGENASSLIRGVENSQVTRAADNVFIPNGPWRSPSGRLEVDADEGVTVTLETGGIRIAGLGNIRSLKFFPEAA